MRRTTLTLGLSLALTFLVQGVLADSPRFQVDDTKLQRLYTIQQLEIGTPNPAIDKSIDAERVRIRADIDDQMNDLINALSRSSTGETLSLAGALSQQKTLVNALQARKDSTSVDLDLLKTEEEKFYKEPIAETGAVAQGRLTQSYPELLTRRAVLEETSHSLDFFLGIENDRLNRLVIQQRLQQFSLLITVIKYVLFLLLIIVLERIIRMRYLTKIQNQNTRYLSMKLFTAGVYLITILWVLAQVSTEYPGILTSLAIFGAALAFAIQDVVKDVVGWLIIIQKRLYTLGQRVTIGPYTGDVVDISLLRTTLIETANTTAPDVTRSGQLLYLQNSLVLQQPVVNYHATSDFVEAEVVLLLTFDSDLQRAEDLFKEILIKETEAYTEKARRQNAGRMKYFYSSHEQQGARIFLEPDPRGVRCVLRFPVPIGERRTIVTRLLKNILEHIKHEAGIRLSVDPRQPGTTV